MNLLRNADDWVEIPAGGFIDGLTEQNRCRLNKQLRDVLRAMPPALTTLLIRRLRNEITLEEYTPETRGRILALERTLADGTTAPQVKRSALHEVLRLRREGLPKEDPPVPDKDQITFLHLLSEIKKPQPEQVTNLTIDDLELDLYHRDEPERVIHLDTYYIARFPVTVNQQSGLAAGERGLNVRMDGRYATKVPQEVAEQMCAHFGARLPTAEEWKKAAIGTDGRLYPWGNDWNPNAGYFSYGQNAPQQFAVDGFPNGVGPYGVWNMVGGLPEWVRKGEQILSWGQHPKEVDMTLAWLHHVPVFGGYHPGGLSWPPSGTCLRPVMDRWPKHLW